MKQARCRGCQTTDWLHTPCKVMVYRACRPEQSVSKWNGLFPEGFVEKPSRAYCFGFDWSGWIVLIKSEILITTGMVWPVSSGKWKRPLVNTLYIRCLGRLLDLKWAAKVSKSDVLEEKTNFPRVFDLMLKQRRMRWLGHVVQMNDDRIPEELP